MTARVIRIHQRISVAAGFLTCMAGKTVEFLSEKKNSRKKNREKWGVVIDSLVYPKKC